MFIKPVNSNTAFGRTMIIDSEQMGSRQLLLSEVHNMDMARKKGGVDTPHTIGFAERNKIMKVACEFDGETADIQNNPINKTHLQNLFKNFLAMDKIGMLHGDLSLENLYFSDSGDIVIAGFKNAAILNNTIETFKSRNADENIFPSNARDFEEDGLHEYLASMATEEEQIDFLKTYMQIKSDYHKQRADFLVKEKGLSVNDDAVKIELANAKACLNPDKKIINFELEKQNLYTMGNTALELWKDGCGLADGVRKPNQKINSILYMFDCLRFGLQLRDDANSMSSSTKDNGGYFESEASYIDAFNKKILECIDVSAKKILTPKTFHMPFGIACENRRAKIQKAKDIFDSLYSKIDIKKPYEETKKAIDDVTRFYGGLAFADASVIEELAAQPKKAQEPPKATSDCSQKQIKAPLKYLQIHSGDSRCTSPKEEKQSEKIIDYTTRKRLLNTQQAKPSKSTPPALES